IGYAGYITSKSFCKIAQSCNRLKHLGINIISSCSRLTDTAICILTDSYPNLRSLKLKYCDGISDIAIRKIAQFRCLEHLNLYGISVLSDKSIRIIVKSCSNIQYLNLQSYNITDRAVE
ncbi:3238_t:CDS:2, partial [Funneliformis caledonium]